MSWLHTRAGWALLALLSRDWAGLVLAALVAAGLWALAQTLPEPWRAALSAIGLLVGMLLAAASLRHLATLAAARRANPPPGRLVDLGGYRVHVLAEGERRDGRPPVVWFAGGHAGGHAIHHLHRAFRGETRSILIDRPGTGWSDTGPFPRSTAREAEEMLCALELAGETGPFVWAGHSFGGLLAANIARRRPDRVHTLVLLDPTPLETIGFGPRLSALGDMRRTAWLGGFAQLFGVNLLERHHAKMRLIPAYAQALDATAAVLGPGVAAARAVEANAGAFFAQASIYRELTPEGVAARAWDTVVYDRDLGDLPVWLVGPKDDTDSDIALLPEARTGSADNARRMFRFFAATRERYLAASSRSRRVVAPEGSGHNFVYEHPDWTIGVLRELVCGAPPPTCTMTDPNTASDHLADLAERYWRFECHEIPLAGALAGVALPDAVLFRESADDHARRSRRAAELLAEAEQVASTGLAAQERATLALLKRELSGLVAQHAVNAHLRPWLFPAGPDFTAMFWAQTAGVSDAASAALYVERLATLPAYLHQVQANIEAGHALGYRYPRVVLQAAAGNTRGILAAPPESSAWLGPFKRSAAATQAGVMAQAERALVQVQTRLLPALQAWAAYLDSLLDRGARDALSCIDGPAGADYYRVFVRHFTSTAIEPDEVHDLGLAEVGRIGREIEAVAAEAGYPGDVPSYRHFLAHDPQFVAASADALREGIEALAKRVDRRIPAFFGHLPRITYGIESMPEAVSARMPPAYAQPGPADGSAAGIFWISGLPSKAPSYLHPALVVHEAWPGHLMHMALMHEQQELPAFRRHGAVKYTACIEGWALYCETLGIEMGLYTTPHQHYGRLEMELWRAVRLVVDTGIHAHGWTREQAVSYMAERLTLSHETIEGEVDRYAALPAQALGYQIGNLKLRELRQRAEQTLGARFSHRGFHDAVLRAGAVTLPVLDDLVDDWLQRQGEPVHAA